MRSWRYPSGWRTARAFGGQRVGFKPLDVDVHEVYLATISSGCWWTATAPGCARRTGPKPGSPQPGCNLCSGTRLLPMSWHRASMSAVSRISNPRPVRNAGCTDGSSDFLTVSRRYSRLSCTAGCATRVRRDAQLDTLDACVHRFSCATAVASGEKLFMALHFG